jgi:hypothetical protein
MKLSRPLAVIWLVVIFFALSGCSSSPSEKDVIGKWNNTKVDTLWMEFHPDKTSTGGAWSITKDGQIKLVNADGKVRLGTLKDNKLIFEEFGEYGVFVKEMNKKQ